MRDSDLRGDQRRRAPPGWWATNLPFRWRVPFALLIALIPLTFGLRWLAGIAVVLAVLAAEMVVLWWWRRRYPTAGDEPASPSDRLFANAVSKNPDDYRQPDAGDF